MAAKLLEGGFGRKRTRNRPNPALGSLTNITQRAGSRFAGWENPAMSRGGLAVLVCVFFSWASAGGPVLWVLFFPGGVGKRCLPPFPHPCRGCPCPAKCRAEPSHAQPRREEGFYGSGSQDTHLASAPTDPPDPRRPVRGSGVGVTVENGQDTTISWDGCSSGGHVRGCGVREGFRRCVVYGFVVAGLGSGCDLLG